MIKAIFMDYYGTIAHEMGPIAMEVVQRVYESGNGNSAKEVFGVWWKTYREKLESANGETFKTQHEVALENFKDLLARFHSPENPEELLNRMEEHWRTTAIYEDAKPFLSKVQLPVYFVTNSDDSYVYTSVEMHDLHPTGIITSEQARYSKPRKEIFLYALHKLGLEPSEVIHIGDSLQSDVLCPSSVGIKSIWLNREKKEAPAGVTSAAGLEEVLQIIHM